VAFHASARNLPSCWRLTAATAALDRGFGKPRQEPLNDPKDDRSFSIDAARASGEQLRAAMNQL
jgi:hypothetical protein